MVPAEADHSEVFKGQNNDSTGTAWCVRERTYTLASGSGAAGHSYLCRATIDCRIAMKGYVPTLGSSHLSRVELQLGAGCIVTGRVC